MRPAFLALPLIVAVSAPALAQDFVSEAGSDVRIEEWTTPWPGTRPRDPFTADGARVWFVGQAGDYLGWLDHESGEFGRIEMSEGAGPHNQIVGPNGHIWYAGNRDAHIGRYDVASEQMMRIDMPDGIPHDPHTMVFDEAGENIWFTAQRANMVGRLEIGSWELDVFPVATPDARPYGIRMAPDGRVWVALLGTNKLAVIDPDTLGITEFELPREGARPRRLDVTSDGLVWYVDYAEGYLGALEPITGTAQEWQTPSGADSRPYAMIADGADRLWFVETGPEVNNFVGFDPDTQSFFSQTPVPSGGSVVRHMQFYDGGNEIWFGADTNTIGRAILPESSD
jgi:virginiamycin B lyase